MLCKAIICFWVLCCVGMVSAQGEPPFAPGTPFAIEVVLDNQTPYIGQQIICTVRIYDSTNSPDAHLTLPDFEGFWLGQLSDVRSRAEIIGNLQYIVKEQDILLYPIRSGDVVIGSASYNIGDEPLTQSNRILLQVRQLPAEAPAGFKGAVGQYIDISATLDRQSVKQGDPVSLQVNVTGVGNLEQLSPPEIRIPDGWRIYANVPEVSYTPGVVQIGEKQFQWILVPSEVSEDGLPPIDFSYFNPRREAYETLSTDVLPLSILPSDEATANLVAANREFLSTRGVLPLRPVPGGLNFGGTSPSIGFWLIWILPPAAAIIAWAWVFRQQRVQQGLIRIRQSRALQHANRQLNAAQKLKNQRAFIAVTEAIYTYFGEKLNRKISTLAFGDVQEVVESITAEEGIRAQVLTCLQSAQELQYAPANTADVRPLIAQTSNALTKLDKAWTE